MRSRFGVSLGIGLLLITGAALGQKTAANLAFDVASIRPSAPLDPVKLQADMQAGRMPRFGAHIEARRADYNYMALRELIANAYGVKPFQVSGPDWLATERFDIAATLPEGASKDDAPKMLQALLADRFKLTAHRETAEHPVYALIVAKGGPKMKESPAAPEPIDPDTPLKPGEMKIDGPDGPIRVTRNGDGSATMNMGAKGIMTQRMDMKTQTFHLDSTMVTMPGFADMLTSMMQMGGGGGRQVVDMTELKGNYQVAVELSLADLMAAARAAGMNVQGGPGGGGGGPGGPAGPAPAAEASDPGGGGTSIFHSVEALGLKLESRKAPVEQLVVDKVEKTPTEN